MTNEKIKTKESTIDLIMTGQVVKREIKKQGYTIREIQKKLGLSCPQPIYRWIRGRTLPSVDNLYMLSRILGLTVDDLIVPRQSQAWILQKACNMKFRIRMWAYFEGINADGYDE
ncbi:MAG: helix-turn-helix domain-containing protein [Lachnospiraceae bacterium]|nr:helix-turn-helix domain-containing protein [Lachnospiraceae bacterium]